MSQQINLYSPIFRRQKRYFAAGAMLASAAVIALAAAVIALAVRMQTGALVRQAEESERQLKAALARLDALVKDDAVARRAKALQEEIRRAEARLAERERFAAAVREASAAPPGRSFSEPLAAFARQAVEGVWLTRVALSAREGVMSISGRARSAELVPAYLARLRAEPALAGHDFQTLQVATAQGREDKEAAKPALAAQLPYVEFTIAARAEAEAGKK